MEESKAWMKIGGRKLNNVQGNMEREDPFFSHGKLSLDAIHAMFFFFQTTGHRSECNKKDKQT